jgi:hypothetical protein
MALQAGNKPVADDNYASYIHIYAIGFLTYYCCAA